MIQDAVPAARYRDYFGLACAPKAHVNSQFHQFLDLLYPPAVTPPGWFSLWELPGKVSHHYDTTQVGWGEQAAAQAAEWDTQGHNVFFGVGLRSQDFGSMNRGAKKGVDAIPGFWLDVDLAGPGHSGSNLPPSIDAVVEKVLTPFGVPPSLVVHSGGGLHVYYLFSKPIAVNHENRSVVSAASKAFQARLIALGNIAGWKLDNTSDLARVLRPVGTHNRKTAAPRPVTLLGYSGRRYSFETLAGPPSAPPALRTPTAAPSPGNVVGNVVGNGVSTPVSGALLSGETAPLILMKARGVLERQCDPFRREIAELILAGRPLPQGSRDSSIQAAASWLASALPFEEPEALAEVFERSLDVMASENQDDHPTYESVVSKISRAQAELRPRREAEAVQDQGIFRALATRAGAPSTGAPSTGASSTGAADVQLFPYGPGQFRLDEDGVWWDPVRPEVLEEMDTADLDPEDTRPVKISTPMRLLATTRDGLDEDWGTLLEITNPDGRKRHVSLSLEDLDVSDGTGIRQKLRHYGARLKTGKKAKELLATLFNEAMPIDRVRCVPRVGWHDGRYVLPESTVGEMKGRERVVYQGSSSVKTAYAVEGTREEWRDTVSAPCGGNTRFVLGVSAAFAGALLDLAGEDGGGFHFRGPSSSSKTTILKVAASVHGKPAEYLRTWRATSNGLEGIAAIHNDGLLCIDELGQVEAREAGAAAYMLANGQGKTRASRNGAAREAARWRLLFLSTGETSLAARASESGNASRTQTGQEIRLAEIPIDAGKGMGGVEALHGQPTPAAFAETIKDAASRTYGAVGVAWLEYVVRDRTAITTGVRPFLTQFVARAVSGNASGQVMRVARRFGVVAYAGELATAYGLTAWPPGEASYAAETCFAAWLAGFGGAQGQHEDRSMVSQVRAFLELHGSSRFEPWGASESQRITNRAGVRKAAVEVSTNKKGTFDRVSSEQTEYEYYVFAEAWKTEICRGFDPKQVAATLATGGCLQKGPDGKHSITKRLPGIGETRCYVILPTIWNDKEIS